MDIYYGLYTILALTALLDFFIGKKNKSRVLWIWVIIMTLFGGLRWKTGNDWDQYYYYFKSSTFDSIFSIDRGANLFLEPGFVFCNALVNENFGKFYIYNIFVEFIIMYSIKCVGEKCTSYPLLFFAFIAVPGGSLSFALRSGFAIALAGLGCLFLFKDKWKSYILVIYGASLIHIASLISLIILIVRKLPLGYYLITIAYILTFTYSYIFRDYIIMLASSSGDNNIAVAIMNYSIYDSKGVVVGYAAHLLSYCLLIFARYVQKKSELSKDNWFNTLLWAMLIFDLIQIVFGEELYELKRLMGYFIFPRTVLICYCLYLVKNKIRRLYLPYASFIVLYLFYQITKTCDGYYFELTCIPYKTIFDY